MIRNRIKSTDKDPDYDRTASPDRVRLADWLVLQVLPAAVGPTATQPTMIALPASSSDDGSGPHY